MALHHHAGGYGYNFKGVKNMSVKQGGVNGATDAFGSTGVPLGNKLSIKNLGTKGNNIHKSAALDITFPEYGQGTRTGQKKMERYYSTGLGVRA